MHRNSFIQFILSIALIMNLLFVVNSIEAHIALAKFQDGKIQEITVEQREGYLLTEGDILVPNNKRTNPSAVVIHNIEGNRWACGLIPFMISSSMPIDNTLDIYRAMLSLSLHSGLRFVEIENTDKHKDYVQFVPSDSTICASHVGRLGGRQEIVLAERCKKGSTIHEIMHAAGFWHEQSRADRDNYIRIAWENIKEEKQYNFSKHITDGIDIADYDYDSIMHYGAKAFSKNGKDTIYPLERGKTIGQRTRLSLGDIKALNQLYPSDKAKRS